MPQIRDIKGEVVVVYCEPLITKKMGCHRLSQRVNKTGFFLINLYLFYRRVMNMHLNLQNCLEIKRFKHSSRFVCGHLGYFIPVSTPHSGKIYAGYADVTFFNEPDRYSIK
jgi:hypothetical protein